MVPYDASDELACDGLGQKRASRSNLTVSYPVRAARSRKDLVRQSDRHQARLLMQRLTVENVY